VCVCVCMCMCVCSGHRDTVTKLAISPDGTLVIAGFADGAVVLYDMSARFHADRYGYVSNVKYCW
jgi:WD40 repeat protein